MNGAAFGSTPRVYLEVDSLEPPDRIRSAAVAWVSDVYRQTLAPLAQSTWQIGVLAEPPDRWRKMTSDTVLADAIEEFSTPEGTMLSLSTDGITLQVYLRLWVDASRVILQISPGLVSRQMWPRFQECLVSHLAAAAEALGASTGFITSDQGGPGDTQYERETHRHHADTLPASDRWLRGAFWCTLLSQGHFAALGGVECVERDAPVVGTRRLAGLSGELLLLQATDNLASFDETVRAKLLEYLAPVLPPVAPEEDEVTNAPPQPTPRELPNVALDPDLDADVTMRLVFQGELEEGDRATLDQLLDAWYLLAIHGVLGRRVHNMDAPLYEPHGGTTDCIIGIDLGSAGPEPLHRLLELLVAAYEEFDVPLLEVYVRPE